MTIMISSVCMPLADRIRDIDLELHICEDEERRKNLTIEREIRSSLLADLLAAAQLNDGRHDVNQTRDERL